MIIENGNNDYKGGELILYDEDNTNNININRININDCIIIIFSLDFIS